ncbi:hypothetical protein N8861_02205 [Porticoccus sp.]|jgi:hypothetical protein|nr:hypothetical protein [Porticoccus sp.]MDC1093401.1 hypothetical protein [Porticoccus sp.]
MMEKLKLIINLNYTLFMFFFVIAIFSNPTSFYTIIEGAFKLLGGTSLIFAGINYTLFKNFTIWNK